VTALRKMIIRCRQCWVDIRIQREGSELPACPHCGQAETYEHAYVVKAGKKYTEPVINDSSEEDANGNGSSSPD
jgi:predicted RNA-binding Zn-ribbon protein involved in translation (DUF1610 family)